MKFQWNKKDCHPFSSFTNRNKKRLNSQDEEKN